MREVCGPAWREQATRLMTVAPFPRLLKLHELKESAMAAGLCPGAGIDPLADRAHALEVAGQIWLERAAAVVQDKRFLSRRRSCCFKRVDLCLYT